MLHRHIAMLITFAALAGTVLVAIAKPQNSGNASLRYEFEEIGARLLKQPITPAPFTLTDHLGNAYTRERLSGAWTVVFFGYTHCPDVCPTTLSTLTRVEENFAGRGKPDRPKFVFVSVDPKRDLTATLKKYVTYFSPTLAAVTGEPRELRSLTQSLGSYYTYLDRQTRASVNTDNGAGGDNYLVEHSSDLYVFAPDGKQIGLIFPPFEPERLTQAISKFMQIKPYRHSRVGGNPEG